jgi:hypothetical protein
MAIAGSVCIEYIDGHRVGKRGLAWLIVKPPDKNITAKSFFESLDPDVQRTLRNRFDYWLGGGKHDKYFHGWAEQDYKDSFVFKFQDIRLFGFLCNPREDELSFRVCVLSSYSIKDEWEADKAEKDRMNELKRDKKILTALKDIKEDCLEKKK